MAIGDHVADLARSDVVNSAVKAAPPVGVTAATLLGLQLSDWVMIATLVYTVLQMIFLLRDKLFGKGSSSKEKA